MEKDPFDTRSPFERAAGPRRQRMLVSISAFVLGSAVPITLGFGLTFILLPVWQTALVLIVTALSGPVAWLAYRLARRGRTDFGSYLLVTYLMVMTDVNGIFIHGLFPAVAPSFAPIIIMAGMVLGPQGGFVTAGVACFLWGGGWFVTEFAMVPSVVAPVGLLTMLVIVIIVSAFIFTAFTSQIATRDLKRALDDATYDLVQANRQLEEANSLKSQFMARTSHELRTPLNSIIGFTDLALREIYGPLSSLQQDGLRRVLSNARRLLALINDILDLSKIEAGELELFEESLDVKGLIEVVDMTLGAQAREKKLDINFAVAESMPPRIVGDENRLVQILMNLTDNAIKFTDAGSVSVRLERADAEHFKMHVQDTGRGIREDDFDRIFEEFRQAVHTDDTIMRGTGLGLAITRQLVDMMGGEIRVSSQLGQGSVFEVIMPLRLPDEAEVQSAGREETPDHSD